MLKFLLGVQQLGKQFKILVCRGPSCGDVHGSHELAEELTLQVARLKVPNVEIGWQSCFGRCRKGPNILVQEVKNQSSSRTFVLATPPTRAGGRVTMYNHVAVADAIEIVREHLLSGKPVQRIAERRITERSKKPDGET